jgi:phage tail-like protein
MAKRRRERKKKREEEKAAARKVEAEAEPEQEAATAVVEKGHVRRESALQELKRKLAETEIEVPKLEGHMLKKARKIIRLCEIPRDRVRIKFIQSDKPRNTVIQQRPRAGERIDLMDDIYKIELLVADNSILQYLPSIYQRSDLTGRNFIKDFLWMYQHIFNQTEEKLDNIHTYFDPLECPSDFLSWLASWVAMVLEEDWPEVQKRNIIKRAVELYQLRGTVRGLKIYLKIFTGVEPIIHENTWPYEGVVEGIYSTVGEDTVLMHYVEKEHCFVVELPMAVKETDVDTIRKIHRIIDNEKPAHTQYYVIFAPEEEVEEDFAIEVGLRSTIGVDTWIGTE